VVEYLNSALAEKDTTAIRIVADEYANIKASGITLPLEALPELASTALKKSICSVDIELLQAYVSHAEMSADAVHRVTEHLFLYRREEEVATLPQPDDETLLTCVRQSVSSMGKYSFEITELFASQVSESSLLDDIVREELGNTSIRSLLPVAKVTGNYDDIISSVDEEDGIAVKDYLDIYEASGLEVVREKLENIAYGFIQDCDDSVLRFQDIAKNIRLDSEEVLRRTDKVPEPEILKEEDTPENKNKRQKLKTAYNKKLERAKKVTQIVSSLSTSLKELSSRGRKIPQIEQYLDKGRERSKEDVNDMPDESQEDE